MKLSRGGNPRIMYAGRKHIKCRRLMKRPLCCQAETPRVGSMLRRIFMI